MAGSLSPAPRKNKQLLEKMIETPAELAKNDGERFSMEFGALSSTSP